MERKWIGFSMIIMMLLFGACGAKDENSEQNSSLATDESVEEEIFQNRVRMVLEKEHRKKIYPNDMCPCGSGRKYKKCCGKSK